MPICADKRLLNNRELVRVYVISINNHEREMIEMKVITIIFYLFFLLLPLPALALPAFYSDLEIKDIEVWPNAPSEIFSYTVILANPVTGTGCSNEHLLLVKDGPYHKDALSILLAAQMSGKKIKVRVSECADRPVVDRVQIIND